jgi:type II restriction enzyme
MSLSHNELKIIEEVIKNSLRHKFQNYKPEPASMPFHTRLLGKDRLALYSFIHSLSTNFGTSIFEPVAVALAKNNFKIAKSHTTAGEFISESAQIEIQKIMDNLTTAVSSPNKSDEIEAIRKVCQKGTMRKVKPTKIDVFLESKTDELYLFDIKTAKPNAKVNTIIAIPYNPYEPHTYNRWTIRGMLDLENELKVGNEFWDFLGGKGAYKDLLDCFERVGVELRPEIDEYFSRFK